jgi:hypothetical protein
MTAAENIFLAWGLFCGGVTLLVATVIVLFNATKHHRSIRLILQKTKFVFMNID